MGSSLSCPLGSSILRHISGRCPCYRKAPYSLLSADETTTIQTEVRSYERGEKAGARKSTYHWGMRVREGRDGVLWFY